jgi:hypothetical protein
LFRKQQRLEYIPEKIFYKGVNIIEVAEDRSNNGKCGE